MMELTRACIPVGLTQRPKMVCLTYQSVSTAERRRNIFGWTWAASNLKLSDRSLPSSQVIFLSIFMYP